MDAQMKTIEATLEILEQRSEDGQLGALDLFYFIGAFQSGLCYEMLQRIWPNDTLGDHMFLFEKLGLFASGSSRKALNRFMSNFVANSDFANVQ